VDSGYYAACAGLRAQTQTLDLIANNVANTSTSGYRGQQAMFSSLLMNSAGLEAGALNQAVNDFNVLEGSHLDLGQGNLEATGNALDFAIEGEGFFAVQGKQGTVYTRDGGFQISPEGRLRTSAGDAVLGEQGPITLPSGPISISADGTISVNGAVSGKLLLMEFVPGTSPEPLGGSLYSAEASAVRPSPESFVRQGMKESSNVNAVTAVTELIAVQRRAEMLERAMSAFHSTLNHIAASDLPKV
jgi:flagellar basal-body rod protein FlgF